LLQKHDELLLRDLKLQPLWLLWFYCLVGGISTVAGLSLDHGILSKIACLGGGFLLALGAEKLVTRRIRTAALNLVQSFKSFSESGQSVD
jgi:hypothetical protein